MTGEEKRTPLSKLLQSKTPETRNLKNQLFRRETPVTETPRNTEGLEAARRKAAKQIAELEPYLEQKMRREEESGALRNIDATDLDSMFPFAQLQFPTSELQPLVAQLKKSALYHPTREPAGILRIIKTANEIEVISIKMTNPGKEDGLVNTDIINEYKPGQIVWHVHPPGYLVQGATNVGDLLSALEEPGSKALYGVEDPNLRMFGIISISVDKTGFGSRIKEMVLHIYVLNIEEMLKYYQTPPFSRGSFSPALTLLCPQKNLLKV